MNENLVSIVFSADVSGRRREKGIVCLQFNHITIKIIQEMVAEEIVVDQIELTPSILVTKPVILRKKEKNKLYINYTVKLEICH